jgi:predicted regulator of Ras-like GTPase activity (Roadblock/LC7/MglB family)
MVKDSKIIQFINKELDKLGMISGIIGNLIVNKNGLTVTSNLPRKIEEKKFGALAATMFEAMEMAANDIHSNLTSITIEYEDQEIIALNINEEMILVGILEADADLGLILIEYEEFISNLNKFI